MKFILIDYKESAWTGQAEAVSQEIAIKVNSVQEETIDHLNEVVGQLFQPDIRDVRPYRIKYFFWAIYENFLEVFVKYSYYQHYVKNKKTTDLVPLSRILLIAIYSTINCVMQPIKTIKKQFKISIVSLKHFIGIYQVANGRCEWGCVLENDVLLTEKPDWNSLTKILNLNIGSTLIDLNNHFSVSDFFPRSIEIEKPKINNENHIKIPPYLGTSCGYIVNKDLAKEVGFQFMKKVWLSNISPDLALNYVFSKILPKEIHGFRFVEEIVENGSLKKGKSSLGTNQRTFK